MSERLDTAKQRLEAIVSSWSMFAVAISFATVAALMDESRARTFMAIPAVVATVIGVGMASCAAERFTIFYMIAALRQTESKATGMIFGFAVMTLVFGAFGGADRDLVLTLGVAWACLFIYSLFEPVSEDNLVRYYSWSGILHRYDLGLWGFSAVGIGLYLWFGHLGTPALALIKFLASMMAIAFASIIFGWFMRHKVYGHNHWDRVGICSCGHYVTWDDVQQKTPCPHGK